jgi:hypothetical protein
MTEFILLFLDAESLRDWTTAQQEDAIAKMAAFKAPLEAAGRLKESGGLGPDFDGARVRVENGMASVIDAPFADAERTVGGYLVVDCASRDDAIALAKTCPAAERTTVEVRQLWRH